MASIDGIDGLQIGQASDHQGLTGCTVLLAPGGAVGGVDVRGGAPATRETDCLGIPRLVDELHAVVLAGGSAFGLAAADGVMQYLREQGVGFETGVARVPIVPAAALFDLAAGDAAAYPGPELGYQACLDAAAAGSRVQQGTTGAGTGATVGKALGPQQAMKSGLGVSSLALAGDVTLAAVVAVNAFGSVCDAQGTVLAGPRDPGSDRPLDTALLLRQSQASEDFASPAQPGTNTTIGVIATNARLDKAMATKLAQVAHNGLAQAIRPVHTMFDGDTVFSLATGQQPVDINVLLAAAPAVMAQAIRSAVTTATGAGGLPAYRDLGKESGGEH